MHLKFTLSHSPEFSPNQDVKIKVIFFIRGFAFIQCSPTLMVRSHCPTPIPTQTSRLTNFNSTQWHCCVGAVWTPPHNSLQPIFYRCLYRSRCGAVWTHHKQSRPEGTRCYLYPPTYLYGGSAQYLLARSNQSKRLLDNSHNKGVLTIASACNPSHQNRGSIQPHMAPVVV